MNATYAYALALPLLVLSGAFAACGDDDDSDRQLAGGAGGAAGASGQSGTGGTAGASGTAGGGGQGGTAGGGGSGGEGSPCGGRTGLQCSDATYCDFPLDDCGAADSSGVCRPRALNCGEIYQPVCSCGGEVFSNSCEASAAGHDVSLLGTCTPPEGNFACGAGFCETSTSYCQRTTSDVGGFPDSFTCRPLPAACSGGASCACLAGEVCSNLCAETGGGFTLTCPGG